MDLKLTVSRPALCLAGASKPNLLLTDIDTGEVTWRKGSTESQEMLSCV